MSVVHLMPWVPYDGDENMSFRWLTRELRNSADAAWTASKPVTEPCDHSDAPEGEDVICDARNTYVRAVYGRLVVTVGNGSARSIDFAATPEAAWHMAEQAMAVLVHLEGYEQLTGSSLEFPTPDTLQAYQEAQAVKAQMEEAAAEAEKALRDPELMRQLGLEMLKKARAMGASVDEDSTGERTGQYV